MKLQSETALNLHFKLQFLLICKIGTYFYIVYVHNGVTEVLDSSAENNILTFETNQFSTYALVSYDVKDNGQNSGGDDNQYNNGNETENSSNTCNTDNGNTGDSGNGDNSNNMVSLQPKILLTI